MTEPLARPTEYLYHDTYTKREIVDYMDLLVPFFNNPRTPQACLDETHKAVSAIQGHVPEARLFMGSGYPYYVLDIEDGRIPEYDRFFAGVKDKAQNLNGHFACPHCVEAHSPSSFRPFCNPCGSPIKAMDVVRALPDVDVIMVVDQHSEEIQARVQGLLRDLGYHLPDRNLRGSLTSTLEFMRSVLDGDTTGQRKGFLHPDVLFLATDDYVRAYEAIGNGDLKKAQVDYVALRGNWTIYHDDFAEDLFMSRQFPPFVARDEELWSYAQRQTARFAKSGPLDEVYNRYISFLEHETDGKNYRIATSSPHLLNGVRSRIASYRVMQ